jgi:hypothetical protein
MRPRCKSAGAIVFCASHSRFPPLAINVEHHMPKSKFFRVAIEGATTDTREIKRLDILDMVDTFRPGMPGEPGTYGARIWLEHYRGLIPGSPFDALGDVLAVKAQEDEIEIGGAKQKRMALYAQIKPLPKLVEWNKAGQKIYTSIEIQPDFGGTGKAGFVGLAVTDSPASLGTEILQFSAKNPSFFSARKQTEGNLFTEALETAIELVDDEPANPDPTGVFASIKAMLDKFSGQPEPKKEELKKEEPAAAPAADAAAFAAFAGLIGGLAETVQKSAAGTATALSAIRADVDGLKKQAEDTPENIYRQRQLATGGDGSLKAEF